MAREDPTPRPQASDGSSDAVSAPVEAAGKGTKPYGPGDRIGENYRLRRLLGQGGMGDVWLAHNEALDTDVAVKLVRPASTSADAADNLLREARAAARLGHPAIVRVFDFGRTGTGDPFIVMERLEGEDLATALGRLGQLRPVKAVRTLLPIAHALSAAHAKGIVHRDLKPENVFLARTGGEGLQPKIVDFGIAQVDRGKALTGGEGLLGSPSYMAPEQARGGEVDHRADIWSFSVVLYEAVSGVKPFTGATPEAVLEAIRSSEPPPLPSVVGADDDLWPLLKKGLEKDPAARYATIKEFGEALAAWLLARGITEDISGGSLETAWGERSGPSAEDGLGSVRPIPAELAREPRLPSATVLRRESPPPRTRTPRLIVVTAIAAGVLGTAAGVFLGAKPGAGRKSVPDGAPPTGGAASAASGTATRPAGAPIPVEGLDQIPVDPDSLPAPAAGPKGATGKPRPPGAFGRTPTGTPRRTLKDPFR